MIEKTVCKIIVDDKVIEADEKTLTGMQIKGRAGISIQYGLFLEMHGMAPDQFINDTQSVGIVAGQYFYSVPPCGFH